MANGAEFQRRSVVFLGQRNLQSQRYYSQNWNCLWVQGAQDSVRHLV